MSTRRLRMAPTTPIWIRARSIKSWSHNLHHSPPRREGAKRSRCNSRDLLLDLHHLELSPGAKAPLQNGIYLLHLSAIPSPARPSRRDEACDAGRLDYPEPPEVVAGLPTLAPRGAISIAPDRPWRAHPVSCLTGLNLKLTACCFSERDGGAGRWCRSLVVDSRGMPKILLGGLQIGSSFGDAFPSCSGNATRESPF